MASRECDDLLPPVGEDRIGADEKGVSSVFYRRIERRAPVTFAGGVNDKRLQPDRRCGGRCLFHLHLCCELLIGFGRIRY